MLETHYLAGGAVPNIVSALIAAAKANIPLPFETATAIDLAGRDINAAVETSVNPKVIDAPRDGYLSAVAKDGIYESSIHYKNIVFATVLYFIKVLINFFKYIGMYYCI